MRSVLATGTLLDGSYRIERLLGVGGFGITYMAHDERLNRPVALKEYFPSMLALRDAQGTVRAQDGERNKELFQWGLERFIEEARLLAQLEHPNIVRVNRVCEAYGTAYMVQEYIDGESLGHWLEALRRPPTQSELDALVEPLLDALEVVHSHSMFHRDIAPDNILVRASGVPTLVDFGSARALVGKETQTLAAIVKPGYSPKEQYSTDLRVQGAWSDIYAFAATLYRAVSGSVPADALSRDVSDTMPRAAIIARGRYRQAFLNAIDMAMLPRPGDRPQSIKVWRAMMLDMPAPQTKEPSPPSPFSPLTPRPITIDTPTLQVERSPLHLKEKATNWLLLLGLLVGSAISLFFLSKLPNPLEGLTQRPERQAQTPKTRLPAAPPENPTDQLALFRDRISSGMDQFDRSISGTQAAKSRKFSRIFASHYDELREAALRLEGEKGFLKDADLMAAIDKILYEERTVDRLLSESSPLAPSIIYLKAIQRGRAGFPLPQNKMSAQDVLRQVGAAFPRARDPKGESAFFEMFDRTSTAVREHRSGGGSVSVWFVIREMRRAILDLSEKQTTR